MARIDPSKLTLEDSSGSLLTEESSGQTPPFSNVTIR